ncbi:phage portal protein [Pseudochrobactrum asaccharolyticum]|uniref:Lambda family phage portal protein n=1 Tax=Pseudochrobactrum asaccharolyticum TaxID=354351 RepID=A0A366DKE3_9HYPH|nr:phage portal protein [Pseudochrobactrum asaccharolyticum]RBO90506.1 lambda family phage portal protein [Pseudochrobactrum asaccharolyticum]
MANLLDKAIGYVSPKAGAQRAASRRRMELLRQMRSYEGASGGRHAANWYAPSSTADDEIGKAGKTLRNRSREMIRNEPLAQKIVTSHANNFVGYGITPRPKTGNPDRDKKVMDLFDEWSKVCFTGTNMGFHGGIYLMARMMVGAGEGYVRKRTRKKSDGLPVPLQLQILDAEFCDWSKAEVPSTKPLNYVVQGIEFDAIGNRSGYWMHQSNPSSVWGWLRGSLGLNSKFIPADEIVHFYEAQDNQVHGVPWLTPVMTEIRDLKDYELSENIRKKIEACMVGMVIPGENETDPADPNIGLHETADPNKRQDPASVTDMNGFPFERMEPGMFGVLRNGKDIKFNSPAVSAGVEQYIRTRHRSIAAGVRMPYEIMTGDFSQANFASGKLGILEYHRFVETVQWHIFIPCLNTIWNWFIQAAKLGGKIPNNWDVPVEWAPPERESITRLDDARADLIEVRLGKRSMQDVISSTGRDPKTVLKEIDDWNMMTDETKSKVILDSDPRKIALNGQLQQALMGDNSKGGSDA